MTAPSYAVDLAARLIRCESVTPAEGGTLSLLAQELSSLGFECTRLPIGEGYARIENLFARRGHGCLLYTSPSPRDRQKSRMPSSA